MVWFRPSILICVLAEIAVNSNGVDANSPMEMLTSALNELTRVISIPLSAVTGWSLRENEEFGDDTESLAGAEAGTTESVGTTTDSTVSDLIEEAAVAVHEASEAISGAVASVASAAEEAQAHVEEGQESTEPIEAETEAADESIEEETEEKETTVEAEMDEKGSSEEETATEESTAEASTSEEQDEAQKAIENTSVESNRSFLEAIDGSLFSLEEAASTTGAEPVAEDFKGFNETAEDPATTHLGAATRR